MQEKHSHIEYCRTDTRCWHHHTITVQGIRNDDQSFLILFRNIFSNNIMNVNKLGPDSRPRSSLLRAPGRLRAFLCGVCFVGLVYPLPHFGLLSHVEAVQDEPAQNVNMQAQRPRSFLMGVTTVTPNTHQA